MLPITPPIPGGFAKSWRKELQSDVWLMPPIYHRVWYWLRLNVQYEPFLFPTREKYGIWVLPGQRIASLQQIAEGVSWREWGKKKVPNKRSIKAVLDWLEAQEMVTVICNGKGNAKGTFISIVNWHTYNDIPSEKVTAEVTAESNNSCTQVRKNRNKPIKPLPVKKPLDGFALFREWWMWAFSRMEDDRYIFEAGKDGKCLSSMLKSADLKEVVCKACHYLVDADRFPKGRPTISGLKSSINRYPGYINGRADHLRELGLLPPDGVLLEDWQPWNTEESHLIA